MQVVWDLMCASANGPPSGCLVVVMLALLQLLQVLTVALRAAAPALLQVLRRTPHAKTAVLPPAHTVASLAIRVPRGALDTTCAPAGVLYAPPSTPALYLHLIFAVVPPPRSRTHTQRSQVVCRLVALSLAIIVKISTLTSRTCVSKSTCSMISTPTARARRPLSHRCFAAAGCRRLRLLALGLVVPALH